VSRGAKRRGDRLRDPAQFLLSAWDEAALGLGKELTMRMRTLGGALVSALAVVLLAACGSSGVGDIFGGGGYPSSSVSEVRGTVYGVDTAGDCAIELRDGETYDRRLRNDGYGYGGRDLVVYCDERTPVVYAGRTYAPAALERGDRIAVQVRESGGRLFADRIDVLEDVTPGDGGDREERVSAYSDLRGRVAYVDRTRRALELERVEVFDRDVLAARDYERLTLSYDERTTVRHEGRDYRPESLEPGDLVEVEIDSVRGELIAEHVLVVDDVRASLPR
jgi:hypothetical protein